MLNLLPIANTAAQISQSGVATNETEDMIITLIKAYPQEMIYLVFVITFFVAMAFFVAQIILYEFKSPAEGDTIKAKRKKATKFQEETKETSSKLFDELLYQDYDDEHTP